MVHYDIYTAGQPEPSYRVLELEDTHYLGSTGTVVNHQTGQWIEALEPLRQVQVEVDLPITQSASACQLFDVLLVELQEHHAREDYAS